MPRPSKSSKISPYSAPGLRGRLTNNQTDKIVDRSSSGAPLREREGMSYTKAKELVGTIAREYGATFLVSELTKRFDLNVLSEAWDRVARQAEVKSSGHQ